MWNVLCILAVLLVACNCDEDSDDMSNCRNYTDCVSCMEGHGRNNKPCDWCTSDDKCRPASNSCPLHKRVHHVFNCPRNSSIEYDEVFAKSIVLPLLAAAAAPDQTAWQRCLNNTIVDAELVKNYSKKCKFDIQMSCFAYIAKIKSANAVAIVFRGPTDSKLLPYGAALIYGGKMENVTGLGVPVDSEYKSVFEEFWGEMQPDIKNTIVSTSPAEIWVVGHSYGGALSSVLAAVLSKSDFLDPSVVLKHVTFGEPRFADIKYAKLHDELLPYSFRIINKNDIVPTFLLRKDPNSKQGPFQHRLEVWYPDGMGPKARYVVARMAEDGSASTSMLNISLLDHLYMFEQEISSWWKDNCTTKA